MNNNKTIKIITIVSLIAVAAFVFFNSDVNYSDDFFKIRFYDENQNQVKSMEPLSIVNGIESVSYIDLTVTINNLGDVPLNCQVLSATPNSLYNSLEKDIKLVPSNHPYKKEWVSSLIEVAPLESDNPVKFEVTMRCSYEDISGNQIFLEDKTRFIDIDIEPDPVTADYDVSINPGQSISNIKFKTSDLRYNTGSQIAVTEDGRCGGYLTAYVGKGFYTYEGTTCESKFGDTLIIDLPGNVISSGSGGDGEVKLLKDKSNPSVIWVCERSSSRNLIVAQAYDDIASGLELTSTEPDKEILC